MIRRPPRSTRVRSSAASDVYKRQPPVDPKRKREMPAYGIEQLGKAAKGCTEVVSAAGTWHALMRSAPDFSGWASETRALCMPQHTGARGQVTHVCNTCGVQCVCVQELDPFRVVHNHIEHVKTFQHGTHIHTSTHLHTHMQKYIANPVAVCCRSPGSRCSKTKPYQLIASAVSGVTRKF